MSIDYTLLPEFQLYGEKIFQSKPNKIGRRAMEIHTLQATWQADDRDYFAIQDSPPDFPNMRIVEIVPDEEIQDNAYEIQITAEGIINDDVFIELSFEEHDPDEGFDTADWSVFTRDRNSSRWDRGRRLQDNPLNSVTAAAAPNALSKTAHGLVTGQLFAISFASGFGGLTTLGEYYAIKIDADTFKAATTRENADAGTFIDISSDGVDATITPYIFGREFMFIMDRTFHKHRAKDYWTVDLTLKGMMTDKGPAGMKPAKRRISTSGQSTSAHVTGLLYLVGTSWVSYPPTDSGTDSFLSVSDVDIEYDIPNCVVTDTILSTVAPPTDIIGQFWTPDNPPSIGGFSIFGDSSTYHVPFGWKCTALQSEQIPGQNVWLVTVSWTYQRITTPKEASPAP